MNSLFERLYGFFEGKRVLILGFGREGRSTLDILRKIPCTVGIADKNAVSGEEIFGCETYFGEDYLKAADEFDIIMQSPGVVIKDYLSGENKAKITGQTDLLLRFCDNKIIGITGTKGKSTTSSLINHFLLSCGKKSVLVGNIGVPPLLNADNYDEDTIIVCEMSCHQLEFVRSSPNIAVLLNVYEEHLDHYVNFAAYRHAKENIYRFQGINDTLIYNIECENDEIRGLVQNKITASINSPADIYLNHNLKVLGTVIPLEDVKTTLLGRHNLYNIGVAMGAAFAAGCDIRCCLGGLADFKGLEHRLELSAVIDGVEFVNDSICTIPQAAIAAVKAFDKVDTIIVGGMDRGVFQGELVDFLNTGAVKNVILLPDSGHKLAKSITGNGVCVHIANDMAEAVKIAKKVTRVRCLLSPAAASYGFYTNFEERGRHFKKLLAE